MNDDSNCGSRSLMAPADWVPARATAEPTRPGNSERRAWSDTTMPRLPAPLDGSCRHRALGEPSRGDCGIDCGNEENAKRRGRACPACSGRGRPSALDEWLKFQLLVNLNCPR